MTKNFVILRGGVKTKAIIFLVDENLFVCGLVYLYVS